MRRSGYGSSVYVGMGMNAVGLHFRKKKPSTPVSHSTRFRFSVQQVWKTPHPPLRRPLEPSTKSSPPPGRPRLQPRSLDLHSREGRGGEKPEPRHPICPLHRRRHTGSFRRYLRLWAGEKQCCLALGLRNGEGGRKSRSGPFSGGQKEPLSQFG